MFRKRTMLLLLVLASGITALTTRPEHIPSYVFGRPYEGFMNSKDFSASEEPRKISDFTRENTRGMYDCESSTYVEGIVRQSLDHFANRTSYWQQFYQYNSKFYNGSSNLAFLVLGGEDPIDSKWVCEDAIPYLIWAKKYGAAVFQAEHRYYGQSRPTATISAADLKWLTPEQVLADFNYFIEQANLKYFPEKRMRWVLFGGSYSGTVASWMRVAYPNSSIGCVSSSSALELSVDNYNYIVNMQKSYERTSATCVSNFAAASKKIQSMSFSNYKRTELEDIFYLCTSFPNTKVIRPKDLQYFWSNIVTEIISLSLHSFLFRNRTEHGRSVVCQIMNNASESDLVKRVRNVVNRSNKLTSPINKCMLNIYERFLLALSNVQYDQKKEVASLRVWMYQCCAYLGYFQTTDGGRESGMWGSLLPLDYFVNQCRDLFGPQFNIGFIDSQVQKYRKMFGGAKHYKGTKCVFTNGDMDPWYSLGLLPEDANHANEVFATTIDGGTHGSDMYPIRAEDSASLKAARAFVASKLDYFIRSGR